MGRILHHSIKFIAVASLFAGSATFAQMPKTTMATPSAKIITGEPLEAVMQYWVDGFNNLQKSVGATDAEWLTFIRFNNKEYTGARREFLAAAKSGKITTANAEESMAGEISAWKEKYGKFKVVEKEYPSTVDEFRTEPKMPPITCNPGCDNIDFEMGTLNGWNAFYADNYSTTTAHNITGITGGPCLPTDTRDGGPDPGTGNDYQVNIMTGAGTDVFCPSVPVVSPYGGKYSVRLGDTTNVDYGTAILEQEFNVTASNANFTYQYAVLLENPAGHNQYEQPFFTVAVLDALGDTIPFCGNYSVYAQPGLNGFKGYYYAPRGDSIYVKNWTVVAVPLKKYIGQCVTVIFQVADCSLSGHAGWAYVDASCNPLGLIASSPALCGQKTLTLTAPPGASNYAWTGPTNGIVGSDSTQTITIDSSGNYTVILTPVTGASCNDTITINVGKAPGPPPKPSFTADTICAGQPTTFNNTSNPISGASFYWDFYNLGTYEDSTINPTWAYSSPGTYTVKLHEIYNGCGKDTLITIKVDSSVGTKFSSTTACAGSMIFFTNSTTGAKTYKWNFGDPSSGTADTSTAINPNHIFDTAGVYTVTLIGANGGPCPDTIKQKINVLAPPTPVITGQDSICPGGTANFTATASGGTSFAWSGGVTCPTCAATSANPTVQTTYTCSVSNGYCVGTATWTVYVKPIPVPVITAKPDTICIGDSATLTASGGGSYIWTSNGSTSSTIKVGPTTTTSYQLQVTGADGCVAITSKQVVVVGSSPVSIILRRDSICPYDSTWAVATGGSSYKWLNNGSLADSIMVKPGKTTTYTCVIVSPCGVDTLDTLLFVRPKPAPLPITPGSICVGNSATVAVSAGGGMTYAWSSGQTTSSASEGPFVTAGTYTYTCVVSNGHCIADTTVQIKVHNKPNPKVTPPQAICPGKTVTICATDTTSGVTFKWSTGATTSCITVTPGVTTSYTVVSSNGCADSVSTTIAVDVPALSACCDTTITKGDTVSVDAYGSTSYVWTAPTGEQGTLSCFTCPNPVTSPTVTTTYTVTGTDSAGCPTSRQVTVYVDIPCADFQVPNIFTPNDDGRNDDFVPFYYEGGVLMNGILNPSSYSIVIYDRWGKEMYNSTDATKYWNGRINSTQDIVPDGVYYYIIKATCGSNNYVKKGFVTVLGEK